MNLLLIETFLSVIYNRSITQAANQLYVSQSTVSSRLQQLEEEVGAKLIERRKGIRSIELTSRGKAFVPIAQRYIQLNREIEFFHSSDKSLSLTVACPDSLNIHLFRPLYQQLINADPHVNLRIRTQQSPEIYSMVDNHEADVGFVFHQSRYNTIVTEAVLREKMVVLVSANGVWPEGPIHPSQLNETFELYLGWSEEIVRWHDYWWKPTTHPYAEVDTASLLVRFLGNPLCWALCPVSVARTYRNNPDVSIHECAEHIPERICYMLTRSNSIDAEDIRLFRKHFFRFVEGIDWSL